MMVQYTWIHPLSRQQHEYHTIMNKQANHNCLGNDLKQTSIHSYPLLAKTLINQLHKEYLTQSDISTVLLLSMYNCFGNTFERALKHADTKPLIVFKSVSGQKLWKVQSSKESSIYILPHVNFCKCDAFKYQVLQQNADFTCKHYLSAELNYSRNMFSVEVISDKKMTDLLITVYIGPNFSAVL